MPVNRKNKSETQRGGTKNKKLRFAHEVIETLNAGIILTGAEIKAVREGKTTLQDAYAYFKKHELFVTGVHIAPYSHAGFENHEPLRPKKLLLNKEELRKWHKKVQEKGLTIVPAKLFISPKGWAKLQIALTRGKKKYDKREDIKRRDVKKQLSRLIKQKNQKTF